MALLVVSAFAGKSPSGAGELGCRGLAEDRSAPEKPGINDEFTAYAPTEYDSKVNLALQTGTGPDIVYSRRLRRKNTGADRKRSLPADQRSCRRRISPGLSELGDLGKQSVRFPLRYRYGIYYNKDYMINSI